MNGLARVATLDHFLANVNEPAAQRIFADVMVTRGEGYREYDGLVPFDAVDFIARHHVFYDGTDNPVAAVRHVTARQCARHGLIPPVLQSLAGSLGSDDHVKTIRSLIEDEAANGRDVADSSRYTIRPPFRKNRETSRLVLELTGALMQLDMEDLGIDLELALSLTRPNVEDGFIEMGFQRLTTGGQVLPPVDFKLQHDTVKLSCIAWRGRSQQAAAWREDHVDLLNSARIKWSSP
jgi:hypothetical protein